MAGQRGDELPIGNLKVPQIAFCRRLASRDNKPIGDKMIMNAAFLIQKDKENEFDAAVNRVAKKFGDVAR